MKSSVCIEMIFTEYPFIERISKAAAAGFDAIEFWNWDNKDLPAIKAEANNCGLAIATFQSNLAGTLIHPEQRQGFVDGIKKSLDTANSMGVTALFLLTDELQADRSVRYQYPELTYEQKYESVLNGLQVLAPLAEASGVTLVLEALNTTVDHPGFFLHDSKSGFDLLRSVNSPNIKLLYDIYHMQVMEGNIIDTLTGNLDLIGHVHVADVPGRHQPGTGELNYGNILAALHRAGYQGYVGFEYAPTISSEMAAASSMAIFRSAIA